LYLPLCCKKMQVRSPRYGLGINFTIMKNLARLALVLTCLLTTAAFAQWQWLDKDGRPVFSDRAPPPNIPEKSIVQRPGKMAVVPRSDAAAADQTTAPAQALASAPRVSGIDKALAEKKKNAEAAEAAKRKADEDRVTAAKADNCQRARSAKAGLDSGVRLARVNAKGEREVMDDAARMVETKRIQSIIDTDCK